jgi:hypothetical protein
MKLKYLLLLLSTPVFVEPTLASDELCNQFEDILLFRETTLEELTTFENRVQNAGDKAFFNNVESVKYELIDDTVAHAVEAIAHGLDCNYRLDDLIRRIVQRRKELDRQDSLNKYPDSADRSMSKGFCLALIDEYKNEFKFFNGKLKLTLSRNPKNISEKIIAQWHQTNFEKSIEGLDGAFGGCDSSIQDKYFVALQKQRASTQAEIEKKYAVYLKN